MPDTDRNAPATKGDLQDLKLDLQHQLDAHKEDLQRQLSANKEDLQRQLEAQKDELVEAIRDSQTEVLRAFYSVAESNQKRLAANERDTAGLTDRLALLESRLLAVEKRLNMPPAA